ncbi:MAG: YbaB/EbfC family nucleoid-associated protein [Caldilineae bacterium]|nr:MAG: YbaB/EbfC family nucleoid-associated protein [Caldilineae bacterium]
MAKKKRVRKSYRSPGSRAGGRGGLPGLGGGDMMAQVQQMQEQMAAVNEALADETLEVSAGGGVITVVVTGQQEIREIRIEPDVVDPEDVEMLQDLIVAAVNEALEQSRKLASERMEAITAGLGLPPGLL